MKKLITISVILACCLSACAPVTMFTKAKKRPLLYSENFLGDTIKMPRSEVNKRAWIVYSLWDKNPTFLKRGGKVTLKEMSLMEPMLVVGSKSKGKYLKLVKYAPEILKNEKLTNRKKAAYYGWVDKSQLLLFNTSSTDVRTGFKNMAFTALSDTVALFYPQSFVEHDSVKIFSDLRLSNLTKKAGLYQFVYKYQSSADGKKWLIGSEPAITPDNATAVMLGWIDARMVENAGQRVWYAPCGRQTSLPAVLRIAPVIAPAFPDSGITFGTIDIHPTIDPSDNVIYDVDGNAISYYKRLEMERELKQLNIFFTIEPSASLHSQLPALINAIQNMIPFFGDRDEYDYTFTVVAGDNLHTTQNRITDIVDWMVEHKEQISQQAKAPAKAWVSLDFALDLAMLNPTSSNLFVNIGESISRGEKAENTLIEKLAKINGRLLAFQLYAKDDDSYNNYVLQATDAIEGYAAMQAEKRRGLWVFTDQIRRKSSFRENTHNSYMLDFPARSATQGMIAFPVKGEYLTADVLVSSVDTLLKQIKAENTSLISAFDRAFASTGGAKDKYGQRLNEKYSLKEGRKIEKQYRSVFQNQNIPWVEPTRGKELTAQDTVSQPIYLLITEKESEVIKRLLEELTAMEVDIKGSKKSKKQKARKLVDVRKELRDVAKNNELDNRVSSDTLEIPATDSLGVAYASTHKIRKHIYRTYKRAIRNSGRMECDNGKWRKSATLSAIQQLYTMLPALSERMQELRLTELRQREVLSDAELEELIDYLKLKVKEFDGEIIPANEISSGNMRYYKINSVKLP